jgi:hypothetical protein
MAFYCATMLSMALELAKRGPRLRGHRLEVLRALRRHRRRDEHARRHGLWDEQDGFYYDQIHLEGRAIPLKVRSMVGLIPLFAVEVLEEDVLDALPGFRSGCSGSSTTAATTSTTRTC